MRRAAGDAPDSSLLHHGADDVMNHAWFRNSGFNWRDHTAQSVAAPYVPPLSSDKDSSNFDPYPEDDRVEAFHGDNEPFATF